MDEAGLRDEMRAGFERLEVHMQRLEDHVDTRMARFEAEVRKEQRDQWQSIADARQASARTAGVVTIIVLIIGAIVGVAVNVSIG